MSDLYNILYFDVDEMNNDDGDEDANEIYADDENYDLNVPPLVLLRLFAGIHNMNWVHRTP